MSRHYAKNVDICFQFSLEHPAGGYKKIFESCEELAEPIPAHVSGLYTYNLIYQAFSIW